MPRLLEFARHHPYLILAAAAVILLLIADEVWRRLHGQRELSPAESVRLINQGAAVVDVRAPGDFSGGHVIGARNIPAAELDGRTPELDKYKQQPLLVYCQNGQTSRGSAGLLSKRGFEQVHTLKGGLAAWKQEQFPLERG